MIDTIRQLETPEGVALTMRLAGPMARVLAWLVDALFRALVYLGLSGILLLLGSTGVGIFMVALFLLEWFWSVPFEVGRRGATPGKRIFGLKVVQRDGTPVSLSASILRNLLRAADFFPFAYGVGLIAMLTSREFQRLGDLAADTVVVHDEKRHGKRSLTLIAHPARSENKVPPPLPLDQDERHALTEFAARSEDWSRARRAELADTLTPLTGLKGEASVQKVLGIAAWIEEEG